MAIIDGYLSSQKCGVRTKKIISTKEESYVLLHDIVKDDSGAHAVFTEQGSSASQKTAAKVMDVISRPPDCGGQAADAVSADTQVKLEDAPRRAEFQSQNVYTFFFIQGVSSYRRCIFQAKMSVS